jgi:hypothetical protein
MTFITGEELDTLNALVTIAEGEPWAVNWTSPVGDVEAPVTADWDDVNNNIAALGVTYGFDPLLYSIDLATGEIISIR